MILRGQLVGRRPLLGQSGNLLVYSRIRATGKR